MTNRHKGYVIALENDIRSDESERVIDAIMMIRGVLRVTPIVNDPSAWIEGERARDEFRQKLWSVIRYGADRGKKKKS
jgi:hypothetical protein